MYVKSQSYSQLIVNLTKEFYLEVKSRFVVWGLNTPQIILLPGPKLVVWCLIREEPAIV